MPFSTSSFEKVQLTLELSQETPRNTRPQFLTIPQDEPYPLALPSVPVPPRTKHADPP